jgi:hypothetical protein
MVGGAGYNTVYECRSGGVPLIARPWPRKYDRQRERAERAGVNIVEEPAQAAEEALRALGRHQETPRFDNGASRAVGQVQKLLATNPHA